jgi:DNA-binding NarL/FixJ family response regulator
MSIKVLIADDHEIVRIGLKAIFERSGIEVVAEANGGADAYAQVLRHRPDLVILDVRMPNGDGLSCLTRLKLDEPELPVLMFSSFDNPTYIARAVALGAAGYVFKNARTDEILKAVRAAAKGEMIWTQELMRRVSGALVEPQPQPDAALRLTQRENEVLNQLALGLTNKEIALALGIGYETVKEHVQNVLRKLGAADRTQAAVWAVRNNLI